MTEMTFWLAVCGGNWHYVWPDTILIRAFKDRKIRLIVVCHQIAKFD